MQERKMIGDEPEILTGLRLLVAEALDNHTTLGELTDDQKRSLLLVRPDPGCRVQHIAWQRFVKKMPIAAIARLAHVSNDRITQLLGSFCSQNVQLLYSQALVEQHNQAVQGQLYLRECCLTILRSRYTVIPSNSIDWTKSLFLEGTASPDSPVHRKSV